MVEIFKTNVQDRDQATMLLYRIHQTFTEYRANFDLEDCDHILRVECTTGAVQAALLINLLKYWGCMAELIPDEEEYAMEQSFRNVPSLYV